MPVVILAEKPDQGEKFALALAGKKVARAGGKYVFESEIFGSTIVTWGIGHLVGLSLPEKYENLPNKERWDLANVPFLPEMKNLKYEVSEGKKAQFSIVKSCLEQASEIVIATDPDREGENIAYNIFKLCNPTIFKKPMKRLWINSLATPEILKGFRNLRDASDTIPYFYEANARQIADFLVGMNYTELFTLKLKEKGISGVTSVGRVQTPVNTLVVENDLSIKNFKPQKYKMIECHTTEKEPRVVFKNNKEYFDEEQLEIDTKKFGLDSASKGIVKSVEKTTKNIEPQKLFSLGGIQEYANTRWKYPAKKTDKIIQGLYDRGYLSYPRTDSELITTSEFSYLRDNLEAYKELLNLDIETPCLDPKKRFVDNDKVLEHYALIPTGDLPDLSKFTTDEKNIYEIITKRTCLMFADSYQYENTKVLLDVNGFEFQASGNVPIFYGWKKVDKDLSEKDNEKVPSLPKFEENETVVIKINFIQKVTKEPIRITEGKLIGKNGVMDKLGLGTPATRSSTIETLVRRDYIKIENTKVIPTEKGYLLWDLTKNKDLLIGKPENTAQWEDFLSKIATKEYTREAFLQNIYKYINTTVLTLKETSFESEFLEKSINQNHHKFGEYVVIEKQKVFEIKKEDNSSFIIFKSFSGKSLTLKLIGEILVNGRTLKAIKGFKSKAGKPFEAIITFNSTTNSLGMEFEEIKTESIAFKNYSILDKGKVFEIKEEGSEAPFIIYKQNSGKNLTLSIIKELLNTGRTKNKVVGFISQANKKYDAFLVFDKATKKISKEFI